MIESQYQSNLIKKLKELFPGCQVLKNDPNHQQGMLDLTVLYQDRWAMLEVKMSSNSPLQPNQQHFVNQLDEMSFAAIIHPQNEEDVLDALQEAFEPWRRPRIPES